MSTREGVVAHMAQYADAEVISLRDLEKLFVQVATALNKAGMKELAKDAAARAPFELTGAMGTETQAWWLKLQKWQFEDTNEHGGQLTAAASTA